jgi:hypothetical protein
MLMLCLPFASIISICDPFLKFCAMFYYVRFDFKVHCQYRTKTIWLFVSLVSTVIHVTKAVQRMCLSNNEINQRERETHVTISLQPSCDTEGCLRPNKQIRRRRNKTAKWLRPSAFSFLLGVNLLGPPSCNLQKAMPLCQHTEGREQP